MTSHGTSREPSISVIICTFNRSQLLERCIASISPQVESVSGELVVVNDGSTDDTMDVLASAGTPITQGGWARNRGLNAARNEGIRLAKAPVVLFFDDDQLAPPDYLQAVLDALVPDLDGVGGPVYDMGDGPRTCARCSALGNVTIGSDEPGTTRRLLGGNMAIRARTFDHVGLFDERLSGRGDETEWFSRASDMSFHYDPKLWAWHRRDVFTLRSLSLHAFKQGKATPLFEDITSSRVRNRGSRILRFFAHGLLRRCSHGFEMCSREVGALVASRAESPGRS